MGGRPRRLGRTPTIANAARQIASMSTNVRPNRFLTASVTLPRTTPTRPAASVVGRNHRSVSATGVPRCSSTSRSSPPPRPHVTARNRTPAMSNRTRSPVSAPATAPKAIAEISTQLGMSSAEVAASIVAVVTSSSSRCQRRPRMTVAQFRPLAPQIPAPGNVAAPVRIEPRHRRLVAGELGLAAAERGERSAAEARGMAARQVELSLVDVGGHDAVGLDRAEQVVLELPGDELEPAARVRSTTATRRDAGTG